MLWLVVPFASVELTLADASRKPIVSGNAGLVAQRIGVEEVRAVRRVGGWWFRLGTGQDRTGQDPSRDAVVANYVAGRGGHAGPGESGNSGVDVADYIRTSGGEEAGSKKDRKNKKKKKKKKKNLPNSSVWSPLMKLLVDMDKAVACSDHEAARREGQGISSWCVAEWLWKGQNRRVKRVFTVNGLSIQDCK
ncbi:hypothetical protein MKZ38_010147 [Zalerion maritima]|uniref:Uncharacterized protein n=1 Tax=Zalerion maritima TaxID=339359 RepID=A0AAD5RTY8_9PEZI|nr:hypothetical protein MKZ38_010147 [Zalerion maritima]